MIRCASRCAYDREHLWCLQLGAITVNLRRGVCAASWRLSINISSRGQQCRSRARREAAIADTSSGAAHPLNLELSTDCEARSATAVLLVLADVRRTQRFEEETHEFAERWDTRSVGS